MKKTREPLHERILDDIQAGLEKKMSPKQRTLFEVGMRLPPAPILHIQLIEFQCNLKARQGSITPDFDALYKKKSDLDHKYSAP